MLFLLFYSEFVNKKIQFIHGTSDTKCAYSTINDDKVVCEPGVAETVAKAILEVVDEYRMMKQFDVTNGVALLSKKNLQIKPRSCYRYVLHNIQPLS
jgi:hypothetical protein